jgi:hypothetical protein
MSTNRMTKPSRRPEPYTAPPWAPAGEAEPRDEKLVKVNSAQINTIRQRYQATAKKPGARRQGKPAAAARPAGAAPSQPMRARALRTAELEFRKLAIELGMERARAVVAEVERSKLGSR